ncbi:unnamed protein product [Spirodela intermedia]|uniref:Uncharacterized protein n=2 Tax=Spirodela intermedia TaxID=51605 RepID=A0A7I8LMU1_SPIIN|nr:unnamed protein product [Spirodela intermedia]CAA6673353.1 unnamed protein product [Spirodela intermedia]CAA7410578.1 unnamed protein product [Spirodela intermedia]
MFIWPSQQGVLLVQPRTLYIGIGNVRPWVEHYVGAIDLLGLARQLQEACGLIITMPCRPNHTI